MTPRKGNLMGVRTDIKVLDATIRDGGLCNNFDFSDEFVRELYKTNIKSGVDYMEFGYKASRTLFNEADFGKWKFCKEEDIRAIVGENVSDMKISVMADVGRCDFKTDFLPKSESVIDMVRVACYIHQIPAAIEMIEYFHDLGYETTCNIMAISQAGSGQVGEALEMLCNSSVDVIYLVDSYGSLYPESFPAGELAGSCVLIEKAELRQDGNDAVLTVTLDESHLHGSYQGDAAFRFTAETGYTGPGDVGPFLRVTVHAVTEPLD